MENSEFLEHLANEEDQVCWNFDANIDMPNISI
jgi:hypothetical protein